MMIDEKHTRHGVVQRVGVLVRGPASVQRDRHTAGPPVREIHLEVAVVVVCENRNSVVRREPESCQRSGEPRYAVDHLAPASAPIAEQRGRPVRRNLRQLAQRLREIEHLHPSVFFGILASSNPEGQAGIAVASPFAVIMFTPARAERHNRIGKHFELRDLSALFPNQPLSHGWGAWLALGRQLRRRCSNHNPKMGLTHNLGGMPGRCVSFVSVVGN